METGIITQLLNEKLAKVKILEAEACSTCKNKSSCSLLGDSIELIAINKINAKPGNKILLEFNENKKIYLSALFFILPIIFLIGGYFVGEYFKELYNKHWLLPVITLVSFLLSFVFVKIISKIHEKNDKFYPVIIDFAKD